MDFFTLDIPGFSIAVKAWGNPEHPPLVALHGWLDNANSFDLLAPKLSKHFRLLAIDLPGHGLSSHLAAGCYYHFSDGIFTVMQIIRALKLKQVHLLGHSMGACLASLIAGVAKKQILSLALIEGLGPFSHPADSCCEQLTNYLGYALKEGKRTNKPYPSFESAVDARARQGYLSKEYIEILCQRGLYKKEEAFYWRHDKRLLAPTPLYMTEEQVLSCLQEISARTCLVWADKGFSFNSETIEARARAVKHLTAYHLSGGHHIHMEQPDTVAQCLIEFYQSV